MDGQFEFLSAAFSLHPPYTPTSALHPFQDNELRSNKPPIFTSHVILSTSFTTTLTLSFTFSFPFSYIQAWLRRYDYDLSYVTRNWAQRHTEYFLVLALGRVIHRPFILDFFLYYEGGVVNGELHGVCRMTTRLIFCVYCIAAWVKKSGHGYIVFLAKYSTVYSTVQYGMCANSQTVGTRLRGNNNFTFAFPVTFSSQQNTPTQTFGEVFVLPRFRMKSSGVLCSGFFLSLLASGVRCAVPPVKVSLRTSWPSPPFLLELMCVSAHHCNIISYINL
jgi:hypothetical protein